MIRTALLGLAGALVLTPQAQAWPAHTSCSQVGQMYLCNSGNASGFNGRVERDLNDGYTVRGQMNGRSVDCRTSIWGASMKSVCY